MTISANQLRWDIYVHYKDSISVHLHVFLEWYPITLRLQAGWQFALENFTSNMLFVSPQGKQLWSWNKNENIANMVIKAAVTILKPPLRRESQAMTAIVTISCVKFYQDKGF
jgi:hypothetical protein